MIVTAFGDTILSNEYIKSFKTETMKELFENVDIVTFNLETVVSDNETLKSSDKAICFQTDSYCLDVFCKSIKDKVVCNIANNHIYDYGEQGFTDTVQALKRGNYGVTGERNQVYYKNVDGKKVAFIGAFETDDSVGGINKLNSELEQTVKIVSQEVDICIVHLHWGRELCIAVSPSQVEIAHRLIEAGCDVIIGHHPHVMQHVETYKDGLIIYSLGNFQIPINPFEKMSQYACGIRLKITKKNEKNQISYELIPVHLDEEGIPDFDMSDEKMVKWNRIHEEIQHEGEKVSKVNYYLNFATNYLKESMRAWKMRWKKGENEIVKRFISWCFSGMTIKAFVFSVVDILIGYNRKRNYRIWIKEEK